MLPLFALLMSCAPTGRVENRTIEGENYRCTATEKAKTEPVCKDSFCNFEETLEWACKKIVKQVSTQTNEYDYHWGTHY